ncbi:glucoamylase family protein [Actinomadura rupiterrae]|uniref:glucoamylase family protein n=1 Tax=Actinomadura rupiterrae TaxID=559627 RepID=UPI0020A619B2|nr:glucoamylase family protein [Actinomadura rupiterrae]MCP2341736.1 hypothetical protein [Actinomadura rupiterrae]
MRRSPFAALALTAALTVTALPATALSASASSGNAGVAGHHRPPHGGGHHGGRPGTALDVAQLRRYAADTWKSLAAMADPATGLPADNISGDLTTPNHSTSPTNIATYLWSTVVARDLGLISAQDATDRVSKALTSVGKLARHDPSGQFYNWYDQTTLQPVPGKQFLSSVDNAWLAATLMMLRNAVPAASAKASALLAPMDFSWYFDPKGGANPGTGAMRGGFWATDPGGCSIKGNYPGKGADVYYTCHVYGAPGETRIATYVGIARGQIPATAYFGQLRTMGDDGCTTASQTQKPQGTTRTYLGVPVYEGTYGYRGARFVPTWGGSMFEELMPNILVPEQSWAPNSWGRNFPAYVNGQIQHGMAEAGYGYWGFSPSNDPYGGYRAYGVNMLGMGGYSSDEEGHKTDPGYAGCRDPQPEPAYGDGIVTPHASFLALPYAPEAAQANLANLKAHFDAYGPGGFYDSVGVRSGKVSKRYLALDQGMVMGQLGNVLAGHDLQRYFAPGEVTATLKPLLGLERWDVGPSGRTAAPSGGN